MDDKKRALRLLELSKRDKNLDLAVIDCSHVYALDVGDGEPMLILAHLYTTARELPTPLYGVFPMVVLVAGEGR